VAELPPIIVLSEEQVDIGADGTSTLIGLDLEILDQPLHFCLCAANTQARLADLVEPAWTLSKIITDTVLENIRQRHGRVDCTRGCAACCRSLVPLAVPEILRLTERIHTMANARRRRLHRSFLLGARRILKMPCPTEFVQHAAPDSSNCPVEVEAVSTWYRSLRLDCPFLGKRNCTIYQDRPLACREHFVQGSSSACRDGGGTAAVVDIPLRMVDVLVHVTADLEKNEPEAVMMPLLPVWYERNAHRANQSWPAVLMAERLASTVQATAADVSAKSVAAKN